MPATVAAPAPFTVRERSRLTWSSIPALYLQVALGLALLTACTLLFWKAADTRDGANGAIALVQRTQQQETRWNEQVMLAAFGYARNYDALNRASEALADTVRQFSRASHQGAPAVFTQLTASADFTAFVSKLNEKRALAERMKSAHAIISNSATYLPTLGGVLDRTMDTTAIDEVLRDRIRRGIKDASIGLAAYAAHPGADIATSLRTQIETLTQLSHSAQVPAELGLFASHIGVVLRNTEALSESTQAFSDIDTATALQQLLSACEAQRAQRISTAQWMSTCAAVAGLLGVALLLQATIGSARRYRIVSRSNDELLTSKAEVETQLIQAVKMSAIGQMVAGVAHEINTPLAYVKATFEFLRDQILTNPRIMESAAELAAERGDTPAGEKEAVKEAYIAEISMLLDDGLHGIEQISTLVMSLKNFSRLDHGKLSEFSVEEGLSSALAIARHSVKHVAEVHTSFANVPRIMGSPSHINQVFLNIIMNAAQAMQGRNKMGRLEITTRETENDMIVVTVTDDGPGMRPEVLSRIFDLYFTTKPPGQGSGVGLAICYRIIKNHHGRIEVQSKPGVGTTFSVFLPVRVGSGADPSA